MAKIIFDLSGTLVRESALEYETKMRLPLFEDIKELILRLSQQGHELYLWTMASKKLALEVLKTHELQSYFVQIQARDDGFYKPDPNGIYNLIGRNQAAFMIGDSVNDIKAGIDAGITSIAALWGLTENVNIGIQNPKVLIAYKPLDILKLI